MKDAKDVPLEFFVQKVRAAFHGLGNDSLAWPKCPKVSRGNLYNVGLFNVSSFRNRLHFNTCFRGSTF